MPSQVLFGSAPVPTFAEGACAGCKQGVSLVPVGFFLAKYEVQLAIPLTRVGILLGGGCILRRAWELLSGLGLC